MILGDNLGDGSSDPDGMCEKVDPTRKCLSSGECRICKFVPTNSIGVTVNKYEGCDITSYSPICDANTAVSGVQYSRFDYDAVLTQGCVPCTSTGKAGVVFDLHKSIAEYNTLVPISYASHFSSCCF